MSYWQVPNEADLQRLIDQAKLALGGDAYKASVLDAYIFGYSFAWLYAKQQLQANGAAGSRGQDVPVNAFYTNTAPDAISSGGVAPDANVLYANAFLQVSPGHPVVVQLPDVQNELQFFSVQSANAATQNYQSPYPSSDLANQSSIQSVANPAGGQVLYYWGTDDPTQYQGEFTQRIAVNTTTSFLTGRVLVDPALVNSVTPSTYAVETIAALNAQFVAASYARFAANGYAMTGLVNESSAELTPQNQAAFQRYSGELTEAFFWQTLAQALNQSAPPEFGIGSQAGLRGTPAEYSKQLSQFGIVYTEGVGYAFEPQAVTDVPAWLQATAIGYRLVTDIDKLAADSHAGSWQNVPATLGDYGNDLVGYLMRDVAHVANSPASAVYPLTFNDTSGASLMGGSTYLMVIKGALTGGLPPLAPVNVSAMDNALADNPADLPTVMNRGGFWSFTAYDEDLNVTPAIDQVVVVGGQPVLVNYTSAVDTSLPADAFFNPNTGSAPYTLSSLQLPAQVGRVNGLLSQPAVDSIPQSNQFRFEDNGDLVLILSPHLPADSRYWNNWLPTPLVSFDSDFSSVTDSQTWQPFTAATPQGSPYSMMLRVYNPNVAESALGDAVLYQSGNAADWLKGQVWNFPAIIEASQAHQAQDLTAYLNSLAEHQRIEISPDSAQLYGGFGLNTAVVAGPREDFELSNDGVTISLKGSVQAGLIDVGLNNFQQIEFSDMTLVFDMVGAPSIAVYSLYEAAFDRRADLLGFRYWTEALASGDADIEDIADYFVQSPEFESSGLQTMSDTSFLNTIFDQAFERQADASGFEFWSTALDNGVSRADVLAGFAISQESWNLVVTEQPIGLAMI
jgi:hypothetical protein